MKKRLGLIVNPIAGMGGRVGLKGSDGSDILNRARELGAKPEAPERTVMALKRICRLQNHIDIVTFPYDMGEEEAIQAGMPPLVTGSIARGKTTAEDTRRAAEEMLRLQVDLLLFAGGDGTARDVHSVIGTEMPSLGIPCGVKIHSAVYATSPGNAGELAGMFLTDPSAGVQIREAEVMDIDETSFREDRLSARLHGYLKIPYEKRRIQCAKAGGCAGEKQQLEAIAQDVIDNMEAAYPYIIGTGTTTRTVMESLGLKNTLLGVDAVLDRELIGSDLSESRLLNLLEGKEAKILLGVIGSQGYIFGRGNQQISSRVIKRVGRDNVIVLATMEKIASLRGMPLLVDTGDSQVDRELTGYIQVITGYNERTVLKIEA